MSDKETILKIFNIFNNLNMQINLSSQEDGRVQSIIDEPLIKEFIKNKCVENNMIFEDSSVRGWFDFKIDGTPFNLKEGSGKTADNLSSKKGLVYAITGKELKDNASHQDALNEINSSDWISESDYGIFFFNKITKSFKISSLKNIDGTLLVANGSNLPFQIKLGKLDDTLNHSVEKQNLLLTKKYLESIVKHNIDYSCLSAKINKEEQSA